MIPVRLRALVRACVLFSAVLPASYSAVHAQDDVSAFYKDRNVTLIIGAGMGGSYGMYGQLAARHLRKHVPGQPNIVVQAMPAAAGIAALNYLYSAAPQDGSVIAMSVAAVVFETVLNDKAQFDASKFQYVGRMVNTDLVGLVARRTGAKDFRDAGARRVVFGSPGPRNGLAIATQLVNRAAGTKFRIITGYKGVAEIFHAIERSEVDAISSTVVAPQFLEFMARRKRGESTDFIPVFSASLERLPDLPDIPSLADMNAPPDVRGFLQVFASQGFIGRSLAFPPKAPVAFVEAFRRAFDKMMQDEAFLADAAKLGVPLALMSGAELQKRINAIVADTPSTQVAQARKVYDEILKGIAAP